MYKYASVYKIIYHFFVICYWKHQFTQQRINSLKLIGIPGRLG